MVVNTVSATAEINTVTTSGPLSGEHWFTLAWFIEPNTEETSSANPFGK